MMYLVKLSIKSAVQWKSAKLDHVWIAMLGEVVQRLEVFRMSFMVKCSESEESKGSRKTMDGARMLEKCGGK